MRIAVGGTSRSRLFLLYKSPICKTRGARRLRAPLSGPEVPPTGSGYAEKARNFPATFTTTGNPSKVDSLLSFCCRIFCQGYFAKKNAAATVARGPVPRDRSNKTRNVRSPRGHGRLLLRPRHGEGNPLACACGMRGPKPYGAQRGFLRFTVARGPVPCDLPT